VAAPKVGINFYGAKEGERISLCMIVKDEEELLEDLLFSVISWIDELVVVDTGSKDSTPEIVERYGGKLLYRELQGSFADTRNFGLSYATGDWILVLDADERPYQELMNWIRQWVHSAPPSTEGLLMWRENRIDGELLPKRDYEAHLRLFRRGAFVYQGALHERPVKVVRSPLRCSMAPKSLLLEHFKPGARQERTNEFYRQFAREVGDEHLIAIQGGVDKAEDGRPVPPQMEAAGPIRLNVGSGSGRIAGFLNVDIQPKFNPDIIHDLKKPLPFPDNYVDEIYAAHVLEHFSYHVVSKVLTDWIRVLKPGGKITIKCPDFEFVCRNYRTKRLGYLRAVQLLYGGQTDPDYDTHFTCLDWEWLRSQLTYHGCVDVERRDDLRRPEWLRTEEELVVTAVKK